MYFRFQIFGIGIETKSSIEKPDAGETGSFLTKPNKITTQKILIISEVLKSE